jgi:hypothetical protein
LGELKAGWIGRLLVGGGLVRQSDAIIQGNWDNRGGL